MADTVNVSPVTAISTTVKLLLRELDHERATVLRKRQAKDAAIDRSDRAAMTPDIDWREGYVSGTRHALMVIAGTLQITGEPNEIIAQLRDLDLMLSRLLAR